MARPVKKRLVKHRLTYKAFGPVNIDETRDSKVIAIPADQLEAMRLADLEGLSQNDAADQMGVSRQTFGRIIEQARQSVTYALINGFILSIAYDSNIEICERDLKCIECGHEWCQGFCQSEEDTVCEKCGSHEVIKMKRCGKYCECPLKVNKVL
ncbi:DUF134 domain-containing protein [Seleniivibrio sp.]|uniref:DUF134 domain-containing protein n=1 Tax=Seleniivibrio sp. TaxID=2898801 RepID=UPI0025F9F27E|nr:DUF134 domain-containing protein [Seleniivibrio sp.]MCD8554353.1 DUF134 domain-containing protein [Seleniivibrio sp.]